MSSVVVPEPASSAEGKMPDQALSTFQSVRYVKNGRKGEWWGTAKTNGQVHAGWREICPKLLIAPDLAEIKNIVGPEISNPGARERDYRALCHLLDTPSRHLWITFEEGCLWWCTVRDGAKPNPESVSDKQGHFWLVCQLPWSNHSLNSRLLAIADLPGTVTLTAGFRATVCVPAAEQEILRVIRDEKSPTASAVQDARDRYAKTVEEAISQLHPKDFEQLVDLILARTGWIRISSLGKTQEGIDLEAQNAGVGETAFVQVKSNANQSVFKNYVQRFHDRRERYARMIFAVHSPDGELAADDPAVQVWTADRLARMVVQVGLGEWIANKLV